MQFDVGGGDGGDDECAIGAWECVWQMATAHATQLLSFSPDGSLFATCGTNDRFIKLWYENSHMTARTPNRSEEQQQPSGGSSNCSAPNQSGGSSHVVSYSFIYLPHPAAVTGFTWRRTSKYMPRGSVSNMLVSSCRDNICRVWIETVLPDDGLLAMNQTDPVAAQNPRFHTHRHKHRFMSRLKHIKACFGNRRTHADSKFSGDICQHSGPFVNGTMEPLPTMPSSYSVHDFASYGFHAMGVTPGFHFHLAASINAATDIPLVPSLPPNDAAAEDTNHNFVLHWLNNKEMHFTQETENLLLEVSKRALEKELPGGKYHLTNSCSLTILMLCVKNTLFIL